MSKQPINHVTASDIAAFEFVPELNHYQRLATRTAIYPGQGTPLGLAYVALKLNGEAGEFAEHVGKAMRDDGFMPFGPRTELVHLDVALTPERRALLIKEIGDVLWYLSAACNELGISLKDAAAENLDKLASRSQRGTLQGSGDNR